MQVLTGGALVPSGMGAGGVTPDHSREMSAPGAAEGGLFAVPSTDRLPQPSPDDEVQVGHPGQQPSVSSPPAAAGGGSFSYVTLGGGGWTVTHD